MPTKKTRILICLNTAWNIANFRGGLIRALVEAGYEVIAVAPPDQYVDQVTAFGCRYLPVRMANKGRNPLQDVQLLLRFFILFIKEKPNIYLGYTVKPNVYGSLAAHALHIPTINNVAGLGAVFINASWLTLLVKQLYKLALRRASLVFFQNDDDRRLFVKSALVKEETTDLLPGSGINLQTFAPAAYPSEQAPVRFLLIARMLWDKGVGEFVEAARQLRAKWPHAEFALLGFVDVDNPAAIPRAQIMSWEREGIIQYLGSVDDVRPFIAQAHCVVLPSYREGVPRTLLEAAAMARPIITTDAPGCREVVNDGESGYLCAVRDANDLSHKVAQFMDLPHEARQVMGQKGRRKMETEFDEAIVIAKYLQAIKRLT